MRNNELAARTWGQTLNAWRHSTQGKTILQILALVGIGVAAALVKRIEPSFGIPGSSGPMWLGTMVAGRAIVRRDGGGAIMGATVALMGIPLGLNNTFIYNLGLYGLTGVVLDLLARLPKISITNPIGAIVCGAGAHLVKYGFLVAAAYTASVTKHFLVVGLMQSAALHLAFGIGAGLVGWGAYRLTQGNRKAD